MLSLPAQANEPADEAIIASAVALVNKKLVAPLARRDEERSQFSRAWMPPQSRRVTASAGIHVDGSGKRFVEFTMEAARKVKPSPKWRKEAAGCVYVDTGDVYIRRHEAWAPAAALLGKKVKRPNEPVCQEGGGAAVAAAEG